MIQKEELDAIKARSDEMLIALAARKGEIYALAASKAANSAIAGVALDALISGHLHPPAQRAFDKMQEDFLIMAFMAACPQEATAMKGAEFDEFFENVTMLFKSRTSGLIDAVKRKA